MMTRRRAVALAAVLPLALKDAAAVEIADLNPPEEGWAVRDPNSLETLVGDATTEEDEDPMEQPAASFCGSCGQYPLSELEQHACDREWR